MIIAVSASDASLSSMVNPRFGRCTQFIVMDTSKHNHHILQNTAADGPGGAGVEAVRLLVDQGVEAVVSGYIGPHAMQALKANGITVYTDLNGTVANAITSVVEGKASPAEAANASGPSRLAGKEG